MGHALLPLHAFTLSLPSNFLSSFNWTSLLSLPCPPSQGPLIGVATAFLLTPSTAFAPRNLLGAGF